MENGNMSIEGIGHVGYFEQWLRDDGHGCCGFGLGRRPVSDNKARRLIPLIQSPPFIEPWLGSEPLLILQRLKYLLPNEE